MALSAAQITQVFEILGVPQSGSGEVFGSVATLFGAEFESYDMADVVSRIEDKLDALSDEQVDRVTTLLERHDAITASSPLEIREAAGSRGTLANHPAERDQIRESLMNIVGLAVPSGGFAAEAQRMGRDGCKITR